MNLIKDIKEIITQSNLKGTEIKFGGLMAVDIYVLRQLNQGVDVNQIQLPDLFNEFDVSDSIEALFSNDIINEDNKILITDGELMEILDTEDYKTVLETTSKISYLNKCRKRKMKIN